MGMEAVHAGQYADEMLHEDEMQAEIRARRLRATEPPCVSTRNSASSRACIATPSATTATVTAACACSTAWLVLVGGCATVICHMTCSQWVAALVKRRSVRAVLPTMTHSSQSGHLVQYQPCLWLHIAQGMLRTSFIPEGTCAVQLAFVGFQNRDCFVSSSVVLLVVVSVQHAVACMVFAEHPIACTSW